MSSTDKTTDVKATGMKPGVSKHIDSTPGVGNLIPTHEFPTELGPWTVPTDSDGNPVGEPTQITTPWVIVTYELGHGGPIRTEAGYLAEAPDELETILLQPVHLNGREEWIKRYISRQFIIECFELADADDEAQAIPAEDLQGQ